MLLLGVRFRGVAEGDVEGARAATLYAAWAADHEPETLPLAASMAKAYASDAGSNATAMMAAARILVLITIRSSRFVDRLLSKRGATRAVSAAHTLQAQ